MIVSVNLLFIATNKKFMIFAETSIAPSFTNFSQNKYNIVSPIRENQNSNQMKKKPFWIKVGLYILFHGPFWCLVVLRDYTHA